MPQIIEVKESYGIDFYAYLGCKLLRVCPSREMAESVIAKYM